MINKIMKKKLITMMLAIVVATASAQTQRQLSDFGWQFTHNGKTQTVDLPHDWDIFEGPNSGKGATGTGGGWFKAGKGEYRKTFKTPDSELVKLHFEGVYQKAEVYVNGQMISLIPAGTLAVVSTVMCGSKQCPHFTLPRMVSLSQRRR